MKWVQNPFWIRPNLSQTKLEKENDNMHRDHLVNRSSAAISLPWKVRSSMLLLLFLPAVAFCAPNLLRDPECDNSALSPEYKIIEGPAGHGSLSQFVEDATWNRCLKMELQSHLVNEKGEKNVNFGIRLGGDEDGDGFPCKPDTVYEFKLEIRGKAPRAMLNFYTWDKLPTTWRNRSKQRTSIHLIRPQGTWTEYRGTFRTGANATRAALGVQLWGTEKPGEVLEEKPGNYLLIDKIVIREAAGGLFSGAADALPSLNDAVVYIAPKAEAWDDVKEIGGFRDLKVDQPARLKTTVKVRTDDKALLFLVRCHSPKGARIKADCLEDGSGAIWTDDLIELFFDDASGKRQLNQFVVSAGGKRWMGDGSGRKRVNYDDWQAVATITTEGWTAEVTIPFASIGYDKAPNEGTMIRFNVGRQRPLGLAGEVNPRLGSRVGGGVVFDNSSLSFANGNYHDKKNFAALFLGTMKPYVDKILATAESEMDNPQVSAIVKAIDLQFPGQALSLLNELENSVRLAKLARKKFIISRIPPSSDPALPFLPEELNEPAQKIVLRAAINEQAPVVLALANMTPVMEEYRLILTSGWERQEPQHEIWTEIPGLKTADGLRFPEDHISIRRGVAFKDADTEGHGRRYDILAELNEASTVPVPSREAGLIWITFDCRDVKPGKYLGQFKVIPLNEISRSMRHQTPGYHIESAAESFEVELEVLPITLPERSSMPFNAYRTAFSDHQFDFMKQYDCFMYMVTPWYFTFSFNAAGDLTATETRPFLQPHLAMLMKNLRANPSTANPAIMLGYSCYSIFKRIIVPKSIPFDSPEYWNAWRNWCKGAAELLQKHGLGFDEFTMEIFDEPNTRDFPIEELRRACVESKKAVPEMRLMLTSGMTYFEAVKDLIDDWIFTYYRALETDYRQKMESFRAMPGKHMSIYACGTSMRQDLYRYYRLLPWRALEARCDSVSLYQFMEQHPGADFYRAPRGGVTYTTPNGVIPSIRLESFRLGLTDVKYMQLLEQKAKGNDSTAIEARKFLKQAARDVAVVFSHDPGKADESRAKAIDFLLRLAK
jgi:hypothetical protein